MQKANWKLSEPRKDELAARYVAGEDSGQLSAAFGVCRAAVIKTLHGRGIRRRSKSAACRRLPLNESAFSVITPEAAYWVGFLMADGAISGNAILLSLADKDRSHLEKFKSFLGSGHKIGRFEKVSGGTPYFYGRLQVRSVRLVSDLAILGVTPKKSFTAKASESLVSSRDFWRGVVDGDGCIYRRDNMAGINLVGSRHLLDQFRGFVQSVSPACAVTVRPRKNIFQVHTDGRHAAATITALYNHASTALDRKSKIAADIIALGKA